MISSALCSSVRDAKLNKKLKKKILKMKLKLFPLRFSLQGEIER